MVCANGDETRLVERLSGFNADFEADGKEPESTKIIESMIDRIGCPPSSTLCLMESEVPTPVVNRAEWTDVEFEVAFGSGSTDHVCYPSDVPGYVVEVSPGSKAGQGFIVGNGARFP